jgi:hypothetical protein
MTPPPPDIIGSFWSLTTDIIGYVFANLSLFLAIFFILMLGLGTLFLIGGLAMMGAEHVGFRSTFVTVLFGSILTLIPCLGCIIYWYIIKSRHDTGWSDAIVAWFLGGLIPLLLVFAFSLFLGTIL